MIAMGYIYGRALVRVLLVHEMIQKRFHRKPQERHFVGGGVFAGRVRLVLRDHAIGENRQRFKHGGEGGAKVVCALLKSLFVAVEVNEHTENL